jgi:hypothetical protein
LGEKDIIIMASIEFLKEAPKELNKFKHELFSKVMSIKMLKLAGYEKWPVL